MFPLPSHSTRDSLQLLHASFLSFQRLSLQRLLTPLAWVEKDQREHLEGLPQSHHVAENATLTLHQIRHRNVRHEEGAWREEVLGVVMQVDEQRVDGGAALGDSVFFLLRDGAAFARKHPAQGKMLMRVGCCFDEGRQFKLSVERVHTQARVEKGNVGAECVFSLIYT